MKCITMSITAKSIKILWSAAAGHCSFRGCPQRLCFHEAGDSAPFTLGEMAHIRGDKSDANRHDATQTQRERDDYINLILLCPTHHTLIDRKENEARFSVDVLHAMKSEHESAILARMGGARDLDRDNIFHQIFGLMTENFESWVRYGPQSELAMSHPHDTSAYAVWLSERLATIVPNNRTIAEAIRARRDVFRAEELKDVAKFLIHVRSYEMWVADEIEYAAVTRFPAEFEAMIRSGVDGGI